jgi:hypothetical protein
LTSPSLKTEDFPIAICTQTFLNVYSPTLQSLDGLFRVLYFSDFVCLRMILIWLTIWAKADLFFCDEEFHKMNANFGSLMKLRAFCLFCLPQTQALDLRSGFSESDEML